MVLSVKITILQCMFALLIGVNSPEATADTKILLDDKLSVEGFNCSITADEANLNSDTDFSFFEQTQLDTTKHVSAHLFLFAPKKSFGRFHSTPPIRAPPISTHTT